MQEILNDKQIFIRGDLNGHVVRYSDGFKEICEDIVIVLGMMTERISYSLL